MKVTLRTFLSITGNSILEPYAANLFEEWQHETCIRTRAVS